MTTGLNKRLFRYPTEELYVDYVRSRDARSLGRQGGLTDIPIRNRLEQNYGDGRYKRNEELLNEVVKMALIKKLDMEKQWEKLENSEKSFREDMIQYSEFISKNILKRKRMMEKFEANLIKSHTYVIKIAELQEKLDQMRSVKLKLDSYTEKYAIYQDFLEQCADQCRDKCRNSSGVLHRHSELILVREAIGTKFKARMEQLTNTRKKFEHFSKRKEPIIVHLKGLITTYKKKALSALTERTLQEDLLVIIKNKVGAMRTDLERVLDGITSTYEQMSLHDTTEPEKPYQGELPKLLDQLLYIKRRLLVLQKITDTMQLEKMNKLASVDDIEYDLYSPSSVKFRTVARERLPPEISKKKIDEYTSIDSSDRILPPIKSEKQMDKRIMRPKTFKVSRHNVSKASTPSWASTSKHTSLYTPFKSLPMIHSFLHAMMERKKARSQTASSRERPSSFDLLPPVETREPPPPCFAGYFQYVVKEFTSYIPLEISSNKVQKQFMKYERNYKEKFSYQQDRRSKTSKDKSPTSSLNVRTRNRIITTLYL